MTKPVDEAVGGVERWPQLSPCAGVWPSQRPVPLLWSRHARVLWAAAKPHRSEERWDSYCVTPFPEEWQECLLWHPVPRATILLDKLLNYGIKGTELAWCKSHLTNWTQFVSYDGTNSHTLCITTGVPQGSILGPLLFIIHMNDIHNASSKFHAILFADDTNLTSTLCSFDVNIDNNCNSLQPSTNINKELKNIQIWLEINKLSLNVKKIKFLIFHHKQRNVENLIPPLNLNEQIIERVTDFNFLCLTIDQHLTWNGHVQKISNKISRSLGIMCKLKRFYPKLYQNLI